MSFLKKMLIAEYRNVNQKNIKVNDEIKNKNKKIRKKQFLSSNV